MDVILIPKFLWCPLKVYLFSIFITAVGKFLRQEGFIIHSCKILSWFMGDYTSRRSVDWILNLLTTYTHHSELQVITALSLISVI
jgi:hypothetical protein